MSAERCGYTGKERHPTREAAVAALKRFAAAKGSRKVHFCVFCDGYHKTKGLRGRPGKGK